VALILINSPTSAFRYSGDRFDAGIDPMPLLDLDALRHAPPTGHPIAVRVASDFAESGNADAIRDDFPATACPDLLRVDTARPDPRFGELIQKSQNVPLAEAFSDKLESASSCCPQ
jgi:hypothetical protein